MPGENKMKNTWSILLIFGLLIGFATCVHAWDGDVGKSPDAKSTPAKEDKTPAKKSTSAFDETTTQYLKKFRSINSALVAAHQDLYRYENPDKSTRGIDLRDVLNEDKLGREKKEQEQSAQNKKAMLEEKIKSLQKDAENLRTDLEKYYKGNVPKNVADVWQTEQDYTDYRVSKYK
jgi:hypothetical protein